MPYAADDPRLFFIPEANINTVIRGERGIPTRRLENHWWIAHPEKGLAFWGLHSMAPQANADEQVTRKLAAMLYPWAEVRQVPLVVYDPRSNTGVVA